jgi:hypothetical protein
MATTACPDAEQCGLQKSIGMRAALKVWQSFYCEGCFSRCERFKLSQSGREVPERLLPNGRLLDSPTELASVTSRTEQAALTG